MSKSVKKTAPNSSPNISPTVQKSVGAMLSQEMVKELQLSFQTALATGLSKVQQDLADVSAQTKEQIKGLDNKLEDVHKQVAEMKQEIQKLTKSINKIEKKMDKLQKNPEEMKEKQKELEQNCIKWEMERAVFMLRLQNIPEDTQENVRQIVGEILAPLTDLDPETLQNEIDLAYRVNSSFAKKHNIPNTC